jgi:hypothetical protein
VRVTAITGDTLLKLVGGQVRHELSKYSLTDIHPSLSAIATGGGSRLKKFKSKNPSLPLAH